MKRLALVSLCIACSEDRLAGPQVPPVAVIAARLASPDDPYTVLLDGSGSYDPDDGVIAAWSWAIVANPDGALADFADATEPVARITLEPPGRVVVRLAVVDRDGLASEPAFHELAMVPVSLAGDCLWAECAPQAPHPVGCAINMIGDDPRGCVAHAPGASRVYFQEGVFCRAGRIEGGMLCSAEPGAPLDATSCPINKVEPSYPQAPSGCAPLQD